MISVIIIFESPWVIESILTKHPSSDINVLCDAHYKTDQQEKAARSFAVNNDLTNVIYEPALVIKWDPQSLYMSLCFSFHPQTYQLSVRESLIIFKFALKFSFQSLSTNWIF